MTCSICKRSQPASNFSQYARTASAITRCRACSVACSQCLKPCTTARMFATGTSVCWNCYKAPRTCSRCEQQLPIENFDNQHVSAYDAKKIEFLVCKGCYEEGYRYNNIDEIRCRYGHSRGRAAFDKTSLNHLQQRGTIPACLICQSQLLCDACSVRQDPDKFDTCVLQNAKKYGRKLVCLACQAIGYSPRDCTTYVCVGSETTKPHVAGHLKFTHAALVRNSKNAGSAIPFRCVDCSGQSISQRGQKRPMDASTQEPKKPDDYNVNSLLRTLRQKDSWRCTCKNTQPAPKMRAKSAIAGKSHDPKCMLQRTILGERGDGAAKN